MTDGFMVEFDGAFAYKIGELVEIRGATFPAKYVIISRLVEQTPAGTAPVYAVRSDRDPRCGLTYFECELAIAKQGT